jgi:hypothetical protein
MAQFQLLRCSVALGGDTNNIVVRHRGRPILFPELLVLQFLHGEEFVTDVHVVGTCEMAQDEALTRLQTIYQKDVVGDVFPGARPRLPLSDASIPICSLPVHKPKKTRPDNPDPKLRPLDQFTLAAMIPEDTDAMPGFDNPKPYSETPDDDPGLDPLMMPPSFKESLGLTERPSVEDMPLTRPGFRGQARQARQTPSHLPDVEHSRPKRPGDNEHDRPKG